jgi:hypothetical protein
MCLKYFWHPLYICKIYILLYFFFVWRFDSISGHGLRLLSFAITLRHTTLGRTPLEEWSDRRRDLWQHTTLTTDRHPCTRRDSNPQSQQANNRRPTLYTARPPETACHIFHAKTLQLTLKCMSKFHLRHCYLFQYNMICGCTPWRWLHVLAQTSWE